MLIKSARGALKSRTLSLSTEKVALSGQKVSLSGKKVVLSDQKASFGRIAAPCAHYGSCGGCSLQDLVYSDQLLLKYACVREALAPLGIEVSEPIEPHIDPWRYRNKAELTFGTAQGRMALGYHEAGSYWRVVDINECLLMPESVAPVVRAVRDVCEASGLAAYRQKSHEGFFRHLIVRHSRATQQIMLALITSPGESETLKALLQAVAQRFSSVTSVYWGVSEQLADVAYPDTLTLIAGSGMLEDRMGTFEIRLLPFSFLQPSSVQADRIYRQLVDWVGTGGIAWDLYCGMGLIGMYLACAYRKVYGIEVEASSLSLAKTHAALNRIENIEFHVGKTETLLSDRRFWLQEAKPELVVVDPPRAGLHASVIATILGAKPLRIAYLSCNVASLARDLEILQKGFPRYRVAHVKAFDMFPQTAHVETLVVLERI